MSLFIIRTRRVNKSIYIEIIADLKKSFYYVSLAT